MSVPYGCYGRIGAEYEFFDERWRLHRAGDKYVFRSVTRPMSFILLTARRFLKLAHKVARKQGKLPCFQCRTPMDTDIHMFCDTCREEIPVVPIATTTVVAPTPVTSIKAQLELF